MRELYLNFFIIMIAKYPLVILIRVRYKDRSHKYVGIMCVRRMYESK